jgi:phospholipase C
MTFASFTRSSLRNFGLGVSLFSTILNVVDPPSLVAQTAPVAATPIQHVIIIIGENRSFDHVYATYKPKHGERVSNLLSRRIIHADGSPGVNYLESAQYSAVDTSMFDLAAQGKAIYSDIPAPLAGGATTASDTAPAPFATLKVAKIAEPDLFHTYNKFLTTGATGLAFGVVLNHIKSVPLKPH